METKPVLISVKAARARLGVGRDRMNDLIREGVVKVLVLGSVKRSVVVTSLEAYIGKLEAGAVQGVAASDGARKPTSAPRGLGTAARLRAKYRAQGLIP